MFTFHTVLNQGARTGVLVGDAVVRMGRGGWVSPQAERCDYVFIRIIIGLVYLIYGTIKRMI